jgi:hypothetical protein
MSFWVLAVRSVGLARLSGVSFLLAACPVFGLWILLMLLMAGITQGIKALVGF